ncbi:hypothetical protein R9X47_19140 [Wukongibacter baidiensis]|uniref:hypothetical protein n=1 Tax=Wukongibacter baidiensis TaxID=1723361 RepID=UPI003D7F5344
MNRKLFFSVVILVFLLIGCNYSNSQNRNIYNNDKVDRKKEIDNPNQEIVNTQKLDEDKIISEDDTEDRTAKGNTEKTTKIVVGNKDNNIKKSDNKKSSNIKAETKTNNQEIKKNNAEVKMVSKAPTKETSISVGSKEKPDKIKLTPEAMEAKIVKKYTGLFENLRTEYEGKIDNLLKQAKSEYCALSDEGKAKQKFKLGIKYLKLGRNLEGECDRRFYSLLEKMKVELKANNLESNAVNEAEKQYKSEKSGRQKELFKKAFGK